MIEEVGLIGSVGFPIAAFVMMWRFVTTSMRESTKAIKENTVTIQSLHTLIKAKI